MSVESIRVVLVHDPEHEPTAWVSLLTDLCSGAKPFLVSAKDASAEVLLERRPHRVVAVAPLATDVFGKLMESIPLLAGVQALESFVEAFGGCCLSVSVHSENYLMHDGVGLWTGFGEPIEVAEYPSVAADQSQLPAELVVTAWNDERVALALSHRMLPMVALNFHPWNLGDQAGRELLLAFLEGKYLTGAPSGPPEI